MRPKTTLFYDVDTQHDFLHPSGALYVVDGERILPVLAELTQFARDRAIRIVAQVDRHFPEDPELQRNGGPYPDHCMDGTHGHRKVSETLPAAPLHVESHQLTDEEIAAALEWEGELILEKQHLDVIEGNRNAERILSELVQRYRDVVIYGVCGDICVDIAVQRLLALGANVIVVEDGIADLDPDRGAASRQKWLSSGVQLLSSAEVKSRLTSERH